MARDYFDRYQFFVENGDFKIVPGLQLEIKSTDKYVLYRGNKDRLDKLSQEYYGTPTFGWLIMTANPIISGTEFDIPDSTLLRIPYPLVASLQDYKKAVELYKLYYGE